MLLYLLLVVGLLAVATFLFMQQTKFGSSPKSAKRLERIKRSANFREGSFQNQSHTPDLAEGVSYWQVTKHFFFEKSPLGVPDSVKSVKTDLKNLPTTENVLVWFGHSSYFMQLDGKTFLIDPVFSGAASPVKFTTPSFRGANNYTVKDMPPIDYLIITHDHWDHLDYETVTALCPTVKTVITGLGTGEHLALWGFGEGQIIEQDWFETSQLDSGFQITATPARHFSGRGFKRNQALWVSFVLQTPTQKIFIGGDSGYDKHFATIGEKFGEFDLVLLECGQYNEFWKYIHMMPEQVAQAATDLKAKALMPIHWAKFQLSTHAWDEPAQRVSKASQQHQFRLVTPLIGEKINLKDHKIYTQWWQEKP